jgi:hypothetical protein
MLEKLAPEEPWLDPIVAEVRAAREALLAEAGYDLHALCELLRARQAAACRQVVQRQPRRATRTSEEVA